MLGLLGMCESVRDQLLVATCLLKKHVHVNELALVNNSTRSTTQLGFLSPPSDLVGVVTPTSCSPARALMRERSNSLAELLSLSSSSSNRSKRVLTWLYCCVISTLSKSVVEVMAVASVVGGGGDGGRRPRTQAQLA